MKRIFIILIVLFAFNSIYSQQSRKNLSAYYVDTKGERIEGQISYQQEKDLFNEFDFKTKNGQIIKINKKNIKSFGIIDYDRSFLVIDTEYIKINSNSGSFEKKGVYGKLVIVEEVVKGKADLYQHINSENDKTFYYKLENERPQELIYIKKNINENINEKRVYRGMLNKLFSECQAAKKKALTSTYTLNSLSNAFKLYNECNNSLEFVSENAKTKSDIYLILNTGYSYSNMGEKSFVQNPQGINSVTFGASVFLKPNLSKRLYLKSSFDYYKRGAISNSISNFNVNGVDDLTIYNFKYDNVDFSLLAGMHFDNGKSLSPFIGGGFVFGLTVAGELDVQSTDVAQNNFILDLNGTKMLGFAFEAGLDYKINDKSKINLTLYSSHLVSNNNLDAKIRDRTSIIVDNSNLTFNLFSVKLGYAIKI